LDFVPSVPLCGFFTFLQKRKENEQTVSIVFACWKDAETRMTLLAALSD